MTDEEFFGATPASAPTAGLTDEEFFGGGTPAAKPAPRRGAFDRAIKKDASPQQAVIGAGRDLLGITAAAGDMILGAPARLAGKVQNVGTRMAATRESREIAGQAGAAAENLGWAEPLKNPLGYMAQLFTGAKPPEAGIVEHAMEAMNAGISKYTGGLLTTQDAAMLTETVMDVLGVKTIKPIARTMAQKPPPRGIENQRTPGIIEGEVLPRAEAAIDASQARIARQGRTIEGEAAAVTEPAALPKPQAGAADPKLLAWIAGGSGGALYIANEGLGNLTEEGIGGLTALGAVKAKGGMWHPEAVNRLAGPLVSKLPIDWDLVKRTEANVLELEQHAGNTGAARKAVEAAKALAQWPNRAVTNYLNKYAGTAEDPLAGVPVPYGEGTKTWGELTDAAIKSNPARAYEGLQGKDHIELGKHVEEGRIPADEPIYHLGSKASQQPSAIKAIESYLSHVGDYLRENVPAAKLPQYDLTRAVKETAKWDAEAAKRMEKAAKEQTDSLPVYKDYGDGYKWVEVRGKDEASTKAALQHEGDTMGHCVGGYCDYVESGDSKIYSLRDAKGRSHVTVEVREKGFDSSDESGMPAILQIKGKQNRAPVAEYLPYVQDFVRGGKWGEVKDLGNAGLGDIHGYNEPYRIAADKMYPGQRFLTKEEMAKLEADPADIQAYAEHRLRDRNERGSIDPELQKLLAAGGVGAATGAVIDASSGDDSAINGALLGGAAGLALASKGGKAARKGADYLIGNLSTRIAEIAPPLRRAARDMELEVHQGVEQAFQQVKPFLDGMKKLDPAAKDRLNLALLKNDPNAIAEAIKGNPVLVDGYRQVRNLLSEFEAKSKAMGRFKEGLVDYFPRTVKDFDGLKEALDLETRKGLDDTLFNAEAESMRLRKRPMTPVEQSLVVNRYLMSEGGNSHLPGYAQRRGIKDVTAELQPFYDTPADSLIKFITAAISDQAQAKFFGKDIKVNSEGGRKFTDVDESIGGVAQRLLDSKQITLEQAAELKELLQARFKGGEKSMAGPLQDIRNINNIGLLGSLESAATQMADSVFQLYHQGSLVIPLKAAGERILGRGISPREFGLANHIAEELSSNRASGKALGFVFKPFFAPVDQFGKGVALTGTFNRVKKLVESPAGIEKLRDRWGADYGEDFPQLVADLQGATKQTRTLLVDSLLWQELSNAQPISMLEMSENYNARPGGRLFHSMKTFTEKQIDIVRRDAYKEIASGDPKRVAIGLKNLGLMATVLAFSNIPSDTVKSWLSGVPLKLDGDYLLGSVLKNFGINRYMTDRLEAGKPWETLVDTVAPPLKQWQDVYKAATDPSEENMKKLVKFFPWIGKTVHSQALGGKEAAAYREQQQEKKRLREERMTPEQRQRLREQRYDKKQLRERKAFERIIFEDNRGLTFSDTPASDDLIFDGFVSSDPPKVVRNRYDFARHRTYTPARKEFLDQQDERKAIVNEARQRFGRPGERAAMKLLMERELRQPKRGRVQS